LYILEHRFVLALAIFDQRGQDEQPSAFGIGDDGVDDLLGALARDRLAALGAVGLADTGEQQAEIVINFGDSADGRARVAAGAFLVDGDGGGEALDLIHVRFFHQAQELAGISRK